MSLGENGGTVMPVQPMYGYGNGNGFGCGDGWWIIFLFALMCGGWGNGFGGGNNGLFPYFTATNTDAGVQRGFDTATLTNQLSGINTSLTNGFANAEVAGCNRAMDAMQSAYENQIASMNQYFANQQSLQQTLFGMQSQQAECCCENRLGLANLGADIAREACADRAAVADALKDVIAQNTAQTQRILDKMCQQELDAERRENQNLRTQLNMANLAASQTAQTGRILADNAAQTQALEQYLNPVPIPAYVVQNPNCCTQNFGCGCGGF